MSSKSTAYAYEVASTSEEAPDPAHALGRRRSAGYVNGDDAPGAEIIPLPRLLVVSVIQYGQRFYRLGGVFVVKFSRLDDGTVFARNARVGVHAYGESHREAFEAFSEAFDVQWRSLVEESLDNLTEHARVLRASLQAAVSGVID